MTITQDIARIPDTENHGNDDNDEKTVVSRIGLICPAQLKLPRKCTITSNSRHIIDTVVVTVL